MKPNPEPAPLAQPGPVGLRGLGFLHCIDRDPERTSPQEPRVTPRPVLGLEDRKAIASIIAAALLADLRLRPVQGQGDTEPTGGSPDDTARGRAEVRPC